MTTKIKIKNRSPYQLPGYQTAQSAGVDIRANIIDPVTLEPLQRVIIPTGIYTEIPDGHEIQVRPRSGLAAKHGVTVLNAPGTIDADYRGEIGVILVNLSDKAYQINPGERVAQLVLSKVERIEWREVDQLTPSERDKGGFGSTGKG